MSVLTSAFERVVRPHDLGQPHRLSDRHIRGSTRLHTQLSFRQTAGALLACTDHCARFYAQAYLPRYSNSPRSRSHTFWDRAPRPLAPRREDILHRQQLCGPKSRYGNSQGWCHSESVNLRRSQILEANRIRMRPYEV